jgi:hypothetical protein
MPSFKGGASAGKMMPMKMPSFKGGTSDSKMPLFKGGASDREMPSFEGRASNSEMPWFEGGASAGTMQGGASDREMHQKQHHVPYSLTISINGTFLLIHGIASTLWAYQYVF